MAGDWIKMRGNLWDDPRVGRLCDLCDCAEAQIIGGLYWLWATADQHTEDGILPGLSLRQIDRKTGVTGLGQALCDIGWLADSPEGVRIIRFEEHNGASAKKRAVTAKRVANHRSSEASDEVGNADVTQGALQEDEASVTGALAREREREDISPSLRSGESAGKPRAARRTKTEQTLQTYLDVCKAASKKPLPTDHPIRAWCVDAGITEEMLQVAWCVFRDDHTAGKNKDKTQKDWPAHFANSVRRRWYELWYTGDQGVCWTSNGLQEKAVLENRMKAREEAHAPA